MTREQFLTECRREFHDHLRDKGLVGYIRDWESNAPLGILIAKENREDGYIYLGWSRLNRASSDKWNKYEGFHHAVPRLVKFAKVGTNFDCTDTVWHCVRDLCDQYAWRHDVVYSLTYMAQRALAYYKGEKS